MKFFQIFQYLFWLFVEIILFLFFVPLFKFYKVILGLYLKLRYGAKFKGFLGYIDNMYAKDGDNAKGINEVLAYTEAGEETPEKIFHKLKTDLEFKLFSGTRKYPKKFYYSLRRTCGYSFLLDEEPGAVDKYIRTWKFETKNEFISQEELKSIVNSTVNTALPDQNTKCWELLVGNKVLQSKDGAKIPILIRFSHVFGDGYAFMKFVEDVFSDSPREMNPLWFKNDTKGNSGDNFITNWIMSIHELVMMTVRTAKKHSLSTKKSSSARTVDWIYESDVSDPLFQILKTTARQQKIRYNELVTYVVSQGMKEYFISKSEVPPQSILIGFPERANPIGPHFVLENTFSIGQMRLPIEHPKGMTNLERYNFISKQIQERYPSRTKLIRSNFCMNILMSNLPLSLQYTLHKFSKVSLIFSAVPLSNYTINMAGYEWKGFTVFGPSTDSIPLTVYFTAYNRQLQISVMAAKEVFRSEEDVSNLLQCMVNQIKELQYLEP